MPIAKAPIRCLYDGMNKTEALYAQGLEAVMRAGAIEWWSFEGLRFKIGKGAYYKPDFVVQKPDGTIEIIEVKGFWREAARVRIKTAAMLYPFKFKAIRRERGQWVEETF